MQFWVYQSCHAHHRPRVDRSGSRVVSKEGGVTSACRTLVHAVWHHFTSRASLPTLQHHGLLSPQAPAGFSTVQATMSIPPEGTGSKFWCCEHGVISIGMQRTWAVGSWLSPPGFQRMGVTKSHRLRTPAQKSYRAHAENYFWAILLSLQGRARSKGDYSWYLRSHGVGLVVWTCLGPHIPFFFPIPPFSNGDIYFMPVPPLYIGSTSSQLEMNLP